MPLEWVLTRRHRFLQHHQPNEPAPLGTLTQQTHSDNVLLLRPVDTPFRNRNGNGSDDLVTVATCALPPGRQDDFATRWRSDAQPILEASGARIDAAFVSEKSGNSFPNLPVREGETVFVWVSAFPDEVSYQAHLTKLNSLPDWTESVFPWLDSQVWRPVDITRLRPTTRSNHRW